ncbi:HNH endonuclease [Rhodovulum sulfidophilum]|uniref:HNH endonuclease n=1 Tax=Rhodovulum sulfidophilum TaxID=35806 RepID=UPI001389D4BB|nr:HNH endonuclease [Rhodovulum sulfidophilum]
MHSRTTTKSTQAPHTARSHARSRHPRRGPKAQGGTDDEGNLQAICAYCHKANLRRQSLRRHPGGNLPPGSRGSGRKRYNCPPF